MERIFSQLTSTSTAEVLFIDRSGELILFAFQTKIFFHPHKMSSLMSIKLIQEILKQFLFVMNF
jgi:hypothetical protein